MNINTHDLTLELIQSTLDESFVDANQSFHTLMATKVKNQLDEKRQEIASDLITKITAK